MHDCKVTGGFTNNNPNPND